MKNFLSMSALGCVMLWVAGCANSPATRFYVLSSPPDMQQMAGKTDDKCPAIGIGPVIVPAHLAKPQIATSASENEILYAPFDQWAQPLPDNFSNILVENLSKLVCNKALYQFPRTGGHEPDYRVRVEIISMIGNLDSKAFMEIWWAVSGWLPCPWSARFGRST